MGPAAIWLFCARITWAVLPITAGGAFADGINGWPAGPARLATVVLWCAWAAGLFALFVLRPWGLTLLRVVAPLAVVAAIASFTSTTTAAAIVAIVSSLLAAALVLGQPVAARAGNALAYGDEVRFPLHIPTPLLLGPVPLAVAIIGVGATAGPIALADADLVLGLGLTIVGVPLAFLVARSLHALSRRWLVLVPAGVTLVDELTLVDPVLVRRESISNMRRVPGKPQPGDPLDLRLGTVVGGIEISLASPVQFGRRRGRADAEVVEPTTAIVAVARANVMLDLAMRRRIATS